MGEGNKQMGI